MHVLIRLERGEPPVGTVLPLPDPPTASGEVEAALPFAGWLGLLRVLGQVLESAEPADR